MAGVPSRQRFSLDPDAIAEYREQLRAMAAGIPIAEAAIEGFSDWQVIGAIERLWAEEGLGKEPRVAGTLAPKSPESPYPTFQG
jgi:hypothetical protein